ncbi:MAG: hypoxanthine phosphoribosyltransferase [Acidobacteriia bacterium]|nr:hypoxanthine phosphoribosyltransferase [Terriglobia bacterium]
MKRASRGVKAPPKAAAEQAGNHLRIVYSARQVQERVRKLAEKINRDYRGRTLHVVGILENCFVFMADLVRQLKMPVVCHFMKAEVHDTSAGTVAVREIMYTPRVEATGRDVLLLDGILQSGLTLDHLYRYILGQNPASVRTATLVEKTDERKVDVATDYVGFKSTAKFLVGYGLGYQEKYRNLPYVAKVVEAESKT